jgi:hypothetical protein
MLGAVEQAAGLPGCGRICLAQGSAAGAPREDVGHEEVHEAPQLHEVVLGSN